MKDFLIWIKLNFRDRYISENLGKAARRLGLPWWAYGWLYRGDDDADRHDEVCKTFFAAAASPGEARAMLRELYLRSLPFTRCDFQAISDDEWGEWWSAMWDVAQADGVVSPDDYWIDDKEIPVGGKTHSTKEPWRWFWSC